MDEVIRYVKNHNLGFTIPYTINGEAEATTSPTSSSCIDDGHGRRRSACNLILEVTGEKKKDKGGQGCHGPQPLGSRRQQPRRFRPLGVHRNRRPLGRRKHDSRPF